jgi:nitrile hydratase
MSDSQPGRTRFKPGDRVLIDDRSAVGHCRTPRYLRGHIGEVTEIQGAFRDPELLAYHRPGLPARVLYKVRFQQHDLWPAYAGPPTDRLEADIYEHWLRPVPTERRR